MPRKDSNEIALVPDRGWLTLKQAAQLSGTSVPKLRRMIRLGELHAFTIERNGQTKFRVLRSALIDAGLLGVQPPPGQAASLDVLSLIREQNARIARLEDQRAQIAGQLGIALERLRSIDERLGHLERDDEPAGTAKSDHADETNPPDSETPGNTSSNIPNALPALRAGALVRKSLGRAAAVASNRTWRRGRTP